MTGLQRLAQAAVAILGLIAAAISYDHIRRLAQTHGEAGWAAYAIPLTIDGIEIITTLALLTHRHQDHSTRWLAWTMLAAATLASIAANIAAAPADPIGRAIAAWPAAAFAAAIKLLTTLLDPPHPASEPDTDPPQDQPANTLRLPKTDRARARWNTIWSDHLATGDSATELAARHHVSSRQTRTILAAGHAGKLDPPPDSDSEDATRRPTNRSVVLDE